MVRFLAELLIMGLIVLLGTYIVPGVTVSGYGTAILVAVLIAVANASIGLILRILTFPINFLTLGLVSFIISVLMILLVDYFMTGFSVSGFFAAAIFAIVIAILKAIFGAAMKKD